MLSLGSIFRRYGPAYIERFNDHILPGHKRAIIDISKCCTPEAGEHIKKCDQCGYEHYAYNSCGNRSCPQCHQKDSKKWLQKMVRLLLPVHYFHLVFTLPSELRHLVRSNQKVMYNIMIKSAVYSLEKLAKDNHYLGGNIGIIAVLHTWSRTMDYHPHVHFLVPGIAISSDHQIIYPSKGNYLVPVKALSKIYKAKLLELTIIALPSKKITWKKAWKWCVHCKPIFYGKEIVLQYLARYLHRVAISNNRIVSLAEGKVTFKYKRVNGNEWKKMTLPVMEFIRRFLQHVLPRGFHKIRYYGLLSPTNRALLSEIRTYLLLKSKSLVLSTGNQSQSTLGSDDFKTDNKLICPICGIGHMVFVRRSRYVFTFTPTQKRGPPCSTLHIHTSS
jgi:hypothetical protein